MVLTVRAARIDDSSSAANLLNAIVRQGGTTAIQTELTHAEVRDWFILGDDVLCAHIAEDDGQIVGWQSVGRLASLPDRWGNMATFARVGSTARGIGTALFAATRTKAKALGLTHLNAIIRADNASGLSYYARMGFVDYKIDRDVPLADGTPVDRISKRFDLRASLTKA